MRHLVGTAARVVAGRPLAVALLTGAVLALALLGLVTERDRSSSDQDSVAVPQAREAGRRAIKVTQASWVFRPASLVELVRHSPAAVEARVIAIRPGPPLMPEPDRATSVAAPAIPTQRIELAVTRAWWGTGGGRIGIFKTGSETEYIEDDPFYAVGEDYLIFLGERRPDGSLLPSAPDGRLRVVAGRLQPVAKGPVGDLLADVPVEGARRATLAVRSGG